MISCSSLPYQQAFHYDAQVPMENQVPPDINENQDSEVEEGEVRDNQSG